jgi:hypothetical protein
MMINPDHDRLVEMRTLLEAALAGRQTAFQASIRAQANKIMNDPRIGDLVDYNDPRVSAIVDLDGYAWYRVSEDGFICNPSNPDDEVLTFSELERYEPLNVYALTKED